MSFREPLLLLGAGARPAGAARPTCSRSGGGGASPSATRTSTCWPRWPAASGRATSPPRSRCSRSPRCWSRSRGPQRTVAAERREATVMLVFDTSRLDARHRRRARPRLAAGAGRGAHVRQASCRTSSASASSRFGTSAEQLVEPTTDHAARDGGDRRRCRSRGATAMGDALAARDRRRAHAGHRRPRAAAPAAGGDRAALRRREHARRGPDRRSRSSAKKLQDPDLHGRARHARTARCSHRPNTGGRSTEPSRRTR